MGLILLALAGLSVLAIFSKAEIHGRLGVLLVMAAVIEIAHGLRRSDDASERKAWQHGAVSLLLGLLLINAPFLAGSALVLVLAVSFLVDGIRTLGQAVGRRELRTSSRWLDLVGGLVYCLIAAVLVISIREVEEFVLALAVAARILGMASHVMRTPVFIPADADREVVTDLGLPENGELNGMATRIAEQEAARVSADRGWIIGFIATLFAIHITRMGFDRSFLGIFSPAFAVLGDLFVALVLAFLLVIPSSMLIRRVTRGVERRTWLWYFSIPEAERGWMRWIARPILIYGLRSAIRLRQARYSFRTAIGRGLQTGLPLAAILAATAPMFGMSWYFDTENWAAGVWNSWAEERTDTWREAMASAVLAQSPTTNPARTFAVHPPDISGLDGFSFIVIGDTGEGDASQHSLRAAYLDVVQRPDVKFVVLSSDVVYPTGAMRHYEHNFWLPFMGTTKPMYAIPGNHDWYDALEGFVATFLEPSSAKLAMRARLEADLRISSTTDAQIDRLIAQATFLRSQYGVPTQQQAVPYFQIQTDTFALFAVDTGVAKRLDPIQLEWLKAALESARGKMKMAILGHPFYAAGHYQPEEESEFAQLHALLREHRVAVVMAGDTHDLEHYVEPQGPGRAINHFVNGGGGAYLSYGTSLDWPLEPATSQWAIYPSKSDVTSKIESGTPWWKWPAWWWTKHAGAWPFSAEFLSAAFDSNIAPFYQSFVEVQINPAARKITIKPYGVHGRLRWRDFQASNPPPGEARDGGGFVEWVIPVP